MVSKFLTSVTKLYLSDFMPNYQLLQDKNWSFNKI